MYAPIPAHADGYCVAGVQIICDDLDAPFIEPAPIINAATGGTSLVAFGYLYVYYDREPASYLSFPVALSIRQHRLLLLLLLLLDGEFPRSPSEIIETVQRSEKGRWFGQSSISAFHAAQKVSGSRMLPLLEGLARQGGTVAREQNRSNRASVKPRMIASNF